jgi:hypothetical protein
MIEMQKKETKFSLISLASGKQVHKRIFETFLKYLYTGEIKDDSMTVQTALFLCECDEFY